MCESIVEKNSEINVNSDTARSEKPKRNAAFEICRIVCIVMVVSTIRLTNFIMRPAPLVYLPVM